jgi:hypothetical protein
MKENVSVAYRKSKPVIAAFGGGGGAKKKIEKKPRINREAEPM